MIDRTFQILLDRFLKRRRQIVLSLATYYLGQWGGQGGMKVWIYTGLYLVQKVKILLPMLQPFA